MELGPKWKFVRGEKAAYDPDGIHLDAIYFANDTKEILMNGVCYGNATTAGTVMSATVNEDNELVVTYADGTPDYVFDLNQIIFYKSEMPDDYIVPKTVGRVKAGTPASNLKEKTISQILDDVLFPAVEPDVTNPVASLSFIGNFVNNGVYEVGSPAPQYPVNFITSFNPGISKVIGVEDKTRAGELINDAQSLVYCEGNASLPEKILPGKMNYIYQAHYGKGEELLTSLGTVAEITPNPLPAGTIKSAALTIYGTYPYFCNGQPANKSDMESTLPTDVTPDTKLKLQNWNNSIIACKFAPESTTGVRMVFDFPALKKLTKVEYMNTISGRWEVLDANEYIVTNLEDPKAIQGVEVEYKRFTTRETSPKKGALQVRFTLADV